MQVKQVDERDGDWEDDRPRFRVYLHGSGESSTYGSTDTYDVTGADVLQVIDWAQQQAGQELTYAVALVRDDPKAEERHSPGSGRGLVWLLGMDGNDSTDGEPERSVVQQRMLDRRRNPVTIPATDRATAEMRSPDTAGD